MCLSPSLQHQRRQPRDILEHPCPGRFSPAPFSHRLRRSTHSRPSPRGQLSKRRAHGRRPNWLANNRSHLCNGIAAALATHCGKTERRKKERTARRFQPGYVTSPGHEHKPVNANTNVASTPTQNHDHASSAC